MSSKQKEELPTSNSSNTSTGSTAAWAGTKKILYEAPTLCIGLVALLIIIIVVSPSLDVKDLSGEHVSNFDLSELFANLSYKPLWTVLTIDATLSAALLLDNIVHLYYQLNAKTKSLFQAATDPFAIIYFVTFVTNVIALMSIETDNQKLAWVRHTRTHTF